ncbi:MAG TPA: hypothetical protein VG095_03210 [Chthoniobacterales bacterium]|nr:hypothetical protein [Chthoniobacterales bacterium]
MFPLLTKTFPANARELERLLSESLARVLITHGDPVRVMGEDVARLDQISINLDHAEVRCDAPPPRMPSGRTSPALDVQRLNLQGHGVALGPANVDLTLEAQSVQLHQGTDARDELVLTLHAATDGHVEVSTTVADVERAVVEIAKREAGKQGVTIEDVRLDLRQAGPRAVESVASFRARKMFFSTTVRITGRLEIDEQLNARLSNLNCEGEGAIGSLACGFLGPHLQTVNGRTFPLMTFSLGEVHLRDVQLSVGNRLTVRAEFGA